MKKLVLNLIALISLLCPLPMSGQSDGCYLMVYHKDNTHSIHMAISKDGYNYTRIAPDGLLFTHGEPGTWNAAESGHPGIFLDDDGQAYLFFQGKATLNSTYSLSVCKVDFVRP